MYHKVKFNINNPEKIWFKNLQKAREAKGYTQVKLAMEAEISQQSITYYETGTRVPSLEVANKLAKILDTSIDYLIGNDDNLIQSYYKLSSKDKDTIAIMIDSLSDKGNN
jgi:transcriptional regulator with XRE-family HTH domain